MELIFPTIEHKEAAWAFRQEHIDHEEQHIHGGSGLRDAKTYEGWLKKNEALAARIPTEQLVRSTLYFGIEDGKIVGILQIRHNLNQFLRDTYGNIGYGVRPTERRKGYASQMLALALERCRLLGLKEVLISCGKTNEASAKTITKNGGVFAREFTEADGRIVQQYWITL